MTAVYRVYDPDGALLYIGASDHVATRIHQHENLGRFKGHTVGHVESIEYASRDEALLAERVAITAETPLLNITDNHARYEQRCDPDRPTPASILDTPEGWARAAAAINALTVPTAAISDVSIPPPGVDASEFGSADTTAGARTGFPTDDRALSETPGPADHSQTEGRWTGWSERQGGGPTTNVQQETVIHVDDSPLQVVEVAGNTSLPALHIELAAGIRLYGTTKDLIDFAGAIVDAVDQVVAQMANA